MTNPLTTRIYGEQVFYHQLMEISRAEPADSAQIETVETTLDSTGAGSWLIRVGVLEYQGDLYRIGGSCLVLLKRAFATDTTAGFAGSSLLQKDDWPHFAQKRWDVDDDTRILRIDTFLGSMFDVLIDPEVGPGPRAIRDMTGHNGNLIPRAAGRMNTARMMTHVNRGGHLVD